MSVTIKAVVRAVLGLSLLVAFTTSAAAALCLQMDHREGSALAASHFVLIESEPANRAGTTVAADDSSGLAPRHACCYQQESTPKAIAPAQRTYPEPDPATAGQPELPPASNGYVPPGRFDSALEKRGHLTPSLTALSISRT